MYEVGSWFIWLLDGAVLALAAFVLIVLMLVKRNQYAKAAVGSMVAEIQLPTGWDEHHLVPVDDNAKSVTIDNFIYMLNPEKRRYGRYPLEPFLGLKWLQVPIRKESWFKDNPEPIQPTYNKTIATSAEIKAMTREIQATTAAMQIQEIDARQKELTDAIANQPNKMIVYVTLIILIIAVAGSTFFLSGQISTLMSAWGLG